MIHLESERKGDWLQTYTGRQFWPLDPRPEEVFIKDIAHALAQLCRYGGHCNRFYSVGQHSVYVSLILPPELRLAGLLHDAAEAYCVDLPRPIKKHLYDYHVIESRLQVAVGMAMGIDWRLFASAAIKNADNAVLLAEKAQVMKQPPRKWDEVGVEPARITIRRWPIWYTKWRFMQRYRALGGTAL